MLEAFGADGEPALLPGGTGRSWRAGSLVLKPLDYPAKEIAWQADVPHVVFATRLRNGNTLVCNFEDRLVVELDRAGKTVSKQKLAGRPFAARRY